MRALAPDDPAAPFSNRPDHGAAGAFCAWPGVTAYGLAKLGRKDLALQLLSVVHESASGGLWGQAMEIVADYRGEWVRVAEDGVSNRDSIAGVAIAEAVVIRTVRLRADFYQPQQGPAARQHRSARHRIAVEHQRRSAGRVQTTRSRAKRPTNLKPERVP